MKLRVRSSTGARTVHTQPAWTLADLKTELDASSLRAGYPPKPVDAADTQPLSELFRDGDILVVSESSTASTPTAPPSRTPSRSIQMRVCEVPDDNSCLFRSVNALLSRPSTDTSVYALRQEVCGVVAQGGALYNEAFLGRPNAEYCAWIMSDNAWGGAIELSILAERFAVELAAFDVKTMRLDRYGEGRGYAKVGFLVYDGIHYNYMAGGKEGKDTLFAVKNEAVMREARALAQGQHDTNKFTDTANFALRCGQCGTRLRGEAEAVKHAGATGHSQFTEN